MKTCKWCKTQIFGAFAKIKGKYYHDFCAKSYRSFQTRCIDDLDKE